MKTILMTSLMTGTALFIASPLYAGTIERACNTSVRNASRATCSCIQQVADIKLSYSDQKQAAKFFSNPQLAQDTRQSDKPSKERFWLRYKAWGLQAADQCG